MIQEAGREQAPPEEDIELHIPSEDDMRFIRYLWSDPETMQPVGGPVYLSNEQASDWFTRMIRPGNSTDCYRLIFTGQNKPIGEISSHNLDSASMTAEFNIKIASAERGKR